MSSDGSDNSSPHEEHDLDVHDVNTGAQDMTAIAVNKLRKGGYCIIEGRPCRVVDITKSKTGKHGHAKAGIAGTDLFTGRRYETHLPTSHEIEVPIVERQDYELLNIDENHTQLLDLGGNMREDVDLRDDDTSQRLRAAYDEDPDTPIIVTILTSLGESIIVDFKRNAGSQQQEQEQEQ